jgi:MoaA/NifB/PqqE/SkfB family radical SAM enzyme
VKIRLSKHGIHYFDRKYGLNILMDEIAISKDKWHLAPRHVSIALTNACDLACNFCYAPKSRAALDIELIKKWSKELDENGTMGIGFGGGEPTLYKQLPELCDFVTSNTNLAVSFTTHGHHLSYELLQRLKGNVHFVRISVDGLGQTYERLRNRSFSRLTQHIKNVEGIAPFGINYVVNDHTISDISQAVDFAIDMGAAEILFLPERMVNEGTGITQLTLIQMKEQINRDLDRIAIKISYNDLKDIPICDPFVEDEPLDSYVHIDAHGILKQSSFDREGVPICATGILAALVELKFSKQNQIIKV